MMTDLSVKVLSNSKADSATPVAWRPRSRPVGRFGPMAPQLTYNAAQHREYLNMIDRVGRNWLEVFQGNTDFYSAVYWDLLTGIWRRQGPVRKTDALKYMTAIKSAHTAGKYLQESIDQGLVVEADNPQDARSKLVMLEPDMRRRLDAFFDAAVGVLRRASRAIDIKGPSPEEP